MAEKLGFSTGGIDIKRVLDACCGSRMFYFDKNNEDVIFADCRELETTLCDGRTLMIKPDVKMDFRDMPYKNNSFKVVVFDPPHLVNAGTGSWLAQKYGILPIDWPTYLKQGFDECMRVLEPSGLLIFKWNEDQIKLSEVLKAFGQKPLLGDRRGKTRWVVFIK
uniref:Methyltransferase small domain n=1 Tax=Siphoviridae sp. ctXmm2 TaxID=2825546 RepID=A0A8S5QHG0_9CAUD|nr:MAG TPA: Methyltransferase small domain [Siphoviridae sp. ctXmm2]